MRNILISKSLIFSYFILQEFPDLNSSGEKKNEDMFKMLQCSDNTKTYPFIKWCPCWYTLAKVPQQSDHYHT